MRDDVVDPLQERSGTIWRLLLQLSDEEVEQHLAARQRTLAAQREAGRGEASWWASKAVSAGEYELAQRRIARAKQRAGGWDTSLPRSGALRIAREPGAEPQTWVQDERWGWAWLAGDEGSGSPLEEVLSDIVDGATIELAGPGCTTADVVAALPPPEEVSDGVWQFVVSIDSVGYGPFPGHGWLPVDDEHPLLPKHRTLVEMTFSEEGSFTSGLNTTLLGEIRPGLLVQYWDFDGMDRELDILQCEPAGYSEQMRSLLVGATDLEDLAIDRALREGSGSWSGDELDPDNGSPTATVTITYDETILPPSA